MNHWQRRAVIAKAEAEGVEVTVANYPGWKFRVRRRCQWNPAYQAAIVRIGSRPDVAAVLERQRANPEAPMSEADKRVDALILAESFAEGCVAGWHGVTDEHDNPMPCTTPNAVRLLEAFPDIAAELQAVASDPARFAPITATAKAAAVSGN